MKKLRILVLLGALLLPLSAVAGLMYAQETGRATESESQAPLSTAFTYQGELRADGEPVTAVCSMIFGLFDQDQDGDPVAQITQAVSVNDGLFTTQLDFGDRFSGSAAWLDIEVLCPGDTEYIGLGRQELTAAPYAMYAQAAPWDGLTGVPDGFADGIDDGAAYSAGTGLALEDTTFYVVTSTIQQRVSGNCLPGFSIRVIHPDGTVECEEDNLGTEPGEGDISAVHAGDGLTGGGVSGEVTLTVAFAGTGTALTVSRADHHHDDRYYTESELGTDGGASVHWGNLTGIPADIADGDDDTIYSPGNQLDLTDTTFHVEEGVGSDLDADLLDGEEGTYYRDWSNLTNVPADIADGDNDALGGLSCFDGEIAEWVDGAWTCGLDDGSVYYAGTGLDLTGATFSITASYRLPQLCGSGQIPEWDNVEGLWDCGDDDSGAGGDYWALTGNSGTTPGAHFLGTTDGVSLTLAVDGVPALRLVPTTSSPNVIGGYAGNSVPDLTHGATVGGGGASGAVNHVAGSYGTVGGGASNAAEASYATIGGGDSNAAQGEYSTIGGGQGNAVTGTVGTIAGGSLNTAGGSAAIGGGVENTALGGGAAVGGGLDNAASGLVATVGGGRLNTASAWGATVGGGRGNEASDDFAAVAGGWLNTASGTQSAICGGSENEASGAAAAIGGGVYNSATDEFATVAGGHWNQATARYAAIGGGGSDFSSSANRAGDDYCTVSGGYDNQAGNGDTDPANADYATVGGGASNTADGSHTTVAGGWHNRAYGEAASVLGGYDNTVEGDHGAILGGQANVVTATHGIVAGGYQNVNYGEYASIGGGEGNLVTATHGTIAGGYLNVARGGSAAVGGGLGNSAQGHFTAIAGGYANTAIDFYAAVGGGSSNTASGVGTVVAGGYENQAEGDYVAIGGGLYNDAGGGGATVGGGVANEVSGSSATVAGGYTNIAMSDYAFIGGGRNNLVTATHATIAGGEGNTVTATHAAVGGGYQNSATGDHATIPGGSGNSAEGDYSFAAGRRARASHSGTFVWADSTDASFYSTAQNQFAVRATGGVRLVTSGAEATVDGNVVWHAGNDGHTSGLNADLLDGQHASSFAGASHDHPEYFDLSENEVVTGLPAFNGGTSEVSSPFTVDSTFMVTNLNADEVDGYGGSELFALGENETVTGRPAFNGGVSGVSSPFTVDSTYRVTNLNADLLDGQNAGDFASASHNHDSNYWGLSGNAGTVPGTQFLGTVDNQAFEVHVYGDRALRIEPAYPIQLGPNLIAGYSGNSVGSGVVGAAIAGGGSSSYTNSVTGGDYATIGGGLNNHVDGGAYASIGGGQSNVVTGTHGTVAGGGDNVAIGDGAVVSGGQANSASGLNATVSGGRHNEASGSFTVIAGGGSHAPGSGNRATDDYGTVAGGSDNQAGDDGTDTTNASYATVGGGASNTASGTYATVGGGESNVITATAGTIAGGEGNVITGIHGTVAGGSLNSAQDAAAAVGGGTSNMAGGAFSTVPGGIGNNAEGDYSFAAGRRAQAAHDGAFVWADSLAVDFPSERADQFRARARGGTRFDVNNSGWVNIYDDGTDLITTSTGAHLTLGGAWTNSSDRNGKENFQSVDPQDVLAELSQVPIATWNYRVEAPSVRHMGPVAQDFHAAFGLGASDTSIATVDADGVALAAIQGLYQLSREQAAQIEALEAENTALREQFDAVEARLAALEARSDGGFMLQSLGSGLPTAAALLLLVIGLLWTVRRTDLLNSLRRAQRGPRGALLGMEKRGQP